MNVNCDDWESRLLPFLGWIGELRKPQVLRADLIAGITVARIGLMDKLGEERMFALCTQVFNYAWDKLGDNHAETRPLRVPRPLKAEA